MPVAQTAKDGTGGELCAAAGGHTKLLQHEPCLLRPHRAGAGAGARGGGGGGGSGGETTTGPRQDELRGEGIVQRTDAHVAAANAPFSRQQHTVQEHARAGEEGHTDAGHRAW